MINCHLNAVRKASSAGTTIVVNKLWFLLAFEELLLSRRNGSYDRFNLAKSVMDIEGRVLCNVSSKWDRFIGAAADVSFLPVVVDLPLSLEVTCGMLAIMSRTAQIWAASNAALMSAGESKSRFLNPFSSQSPDNLFVFKASASSLSRTYRRLDFSMTSSHSDAVGDESFKGGDGSRVGRPTYRC